MSGVSADKCKLFVASYAGDIRYLIKGKVVLANVYMPLPLLNA